jgi:hypothetical protein
MLVLLCPVDVSLLPTDLMLSFIKENISKGLSARAREKNFLACLQVTASHAEDRR